MTRTTPRRRTILHLSQIRFTDARTFITASRRAGEFHGTSPGSENPLHYPTPTQIERGQLHAHSIADQQADEIAVQPICDVRSHLRSPVELHAIERARELLDNRPGYLRAGTGTSRAVRIHGSPAVTATVCSKCADRLLSRVTAVHPSLSTFTAALPALTIGSMASTMPSVSRGPRPGSP